MANDTIDIMPTIIQLHDIIILDIRRLVSMANPTTTQEENSSFQTLELLFFHYKSNSVIPDSITFTLYSCNYFLQMQ